MRDVCARAACDAAAVGAFVTHVPDCTAWLVALGGPVEGVPLCRTHIDKFSVPVGWSLIDQRGTGSRPSTDTQTPSPTNQDLADSEPAVGATTAAEPPAPPRVAVSDPEPTAAPRTAAEHPRADKVAPGSAEDADAEHLWQGPNHAEDEVTANASSPLLSRAFLGPDDDTGDERRLAIFQRSTRKSPATLPDDELPFPPGDDQQVTNGQ